MPRGGCRNLPGQNDGNTEGNSAGTLLLSQQIQSDKKSMQDESYRTLAFNFAEHPLSLELGSTNGNHIICLLVH